MAKVSKSVFVCNSCGYDSPKWVGKCPSCGSWNSFTEEVVSKTSKNSPLLSVEKMRTKPQPILEIAVN